MSQYFDVYRHWRILADNKWQALDFLREVEEKGIAKDFFVGQWAKEEKTGWIATFKKQLRGK
jgi:hypothetical protein